MKNIIIENYINGKLHGEKRTYYFDSLIIETYYHGELRDIRYWVKESIPDSRITWIPDKNTIETHIESCSTKYKTNHLLN